MLLNRGIGEDSSESHRLQGDQTHTHTHGVLGEVGEKRSGGRERDEHSNCFLWDKPQALFYSKERTLSLCFFFFLSFFFPFTLHVLFRDEYWKGGKEKKANIFWGPRVCWALFLIYYISFHLHVFINEEAAGSEYFSPFRSPHCKTQKWDVNSVLTFKPWLFPHGRRMSQAHCRPGATGDQRKLCDLEKCSQTCAHSRVSWRAS